MQIVKLVMQLHVKYLCLEYEKTLTLNWPGFLLVNITDITYIINIFNQ